MLSIGIPTLARDRLSYMLPAWAQRISDLIDADPSKTATALARACGIKPGSVSGWFGKGKPTKMISGDNLVSAAAYLGVSPEWIMTGRQTASDGQSHVLGLEAETLAETAKALLDREEEADWFTFIIERPELFIQAYRLYAERTSDVITDRQLGIQLADLVPLQPRDATGDEREKTVPASGTSKRSMGKGRER